MNLTPSLYWYSDGRRGWLAAAGLALMGYIPASGQTTFSDFTTRRLSDHRAENALYIRWQVSPRADSDTQPVYFTLERAQAAQPYQTLTQVEAGTVSQVPTRYEFLDENAPADTLHYRLGVTDAEGRTEWFHRVTVLPERYRGRVKIVPFPSDGQLIDMTLNVRPSEEISVLIQDMNGRVHYHGMHPPADRVTVRFTDPLKALRPGEYVILLTTRQHLLRERLSVD